MASELTPPLAVIWDMDGVLIDTGESHYLAWRQLLPAYGIDLDREEFARTFGMNNGSLLRRWLGADISPALIEDISQRKEQAFRHIAPERTTLLPNVPEWLGTFQAAGVRQAVASSAPAENIALLLDAHHLSAYFQTTVSGMYMPGKPEPHVYLEAARQIDVPPARCVVIEDAVPGVEGARRAGMKCIAVTTTNPAEALSAADIVLADLSAAQPDLVFRLLDTTPPF